VIAWPQRFRHTAAGRAFWLMEGYFVRTWACTGLQQRLHEHAARRGERQVPLGNQNTLEFDPDIMKRYVNFMSNPDERTAIDQFARRQVLRVAAMMATLPGLPMFGHGQIEGFTEK